MKYKHYCNFLVSFYFKHYEYENMKIDFISIVGSSVKNKRKDFYAFSKFKLIKIMLFSSLLYVKGKFEFFLDQMLRRQLIVLGSVN